MDDSANLLGVSRRTLYDLIASGRLRSTKIGARRVIPHEELVRLLREGAA